MDLKEQYLVWTLCIWTVELGISGRAAYVLNAVLSPPLCCSPNSRCHRLFAAAPRQTLRNILITAKRCTLIVIVCYYLIIGTAMIDMSEWSWAAVEIFRDNLCKFKDTYISLKVTLNEMCHSLFSSIVLAKQQNHNKKKTTGLKVESTVLGKFEQFPLLRYAKGTLSVAESQSHRANPISYWSWCQSNLILVMEPVKPESRKIAR